MTYQQVANKMGWRRRQDVYNKLSQTFDEDWPCALVFKLCYVVGLDPLEVTQSVYGQEETVVVFD